MMNLFDINAMEQELLIDKAKNVLTTDIINLAAIVSTAKIENQIWGTDAQQYLELLTVLSKNAVDARSANAELAEELQQEAIMLASEILNMYARSGHINFNIYLPAANKIMETACNHFRKMNQAPDAKTLIEYVLIEDDDGDTCLDRIADINNMNTDDDVPYMDTSILGVFVGRVIGRIEFAEQQGYVMKQAEKMASEMIGNMLGGRATRATPRK